MILYGRITPTSPVVLLARVEDSNGNLLLPTNVSTISAVVTDIDADTAGDPVSLDVGDAVYSTLQVTDQWTADGLGYNLAVRLTGDNFPSSATTYQVVVTVVPTSESGGNTFPLVWQLQTDEVF